MSMTGKKILITRDENSDEEFAKKLINAGAEIIYFPTIRISDIEDHKHLDKVLTELEKYDGLFFTSANAVKYFFDRAELKNVKFTGKIYSVGEKTKEKVESFGYNNFFTPSVYSAEELLKELPKEDIEGKSFLLPRGNLSMEKLQNGLTKLALIDEVVVYRNSLPTDIENRDIVEHMLKNGKIDCICFFSPSSIKNFILLIPGFKQKDTAIAVIGQTAFKTAEDFGFEVEIIPETATADYMAEEIIKYFNN